MDPAVGWFAFALLLPLLLGIAGLIAQPACYNGDPPAAIARCSAPLECSSRWATS